jgi:hypothetical protein
LSELAPALGVAAVLIGLADMGPYVRDTVRRCTRPHRGTWLIWTVLAVVVSLSQHADGGSWSVAMAVAQAVTNGLVLALAIRLGTGGVSALDVTLIALAGAGSETLSMFAWASLAGALSAAAVGSLALSLLLYPAYHCLANGGLALLIAGRRAAMRARDELGWMPDSLGCAVGDSGVS